jgi:hypothetical protein
MIPPCRLPGIPATDLFEPDALLAKPMKRGYGKKLWAFCRLGVFASGALSLIVPWQTDSEAKGKTAQTAHTRAGATNFIAVD